MTTGNYFVFDACAQCDMPTMCTRHRVCKSIHGALRYGHAEVFSTDDSQRQHLAAMEHGKVEQFRITIAQAAPQGWECPRCHVIHAPQVLRCTCQADGHHARPVYQD